VLLHAGKHFEVEDCTARDAKPNLGQRRGQASQGLSGPIRRPIIDRDDFPFDTGGIEPSGDIGNRLFDVLLFVVAGQSNR